MRPPGRTSRPRCAPGPGCGRGRSWLGGGVPSPILLRLAAHFAGDEPFVEPDEPGEGAQRGVAEAEDRVERQHQVFVAAVDLLLDGEERVELEQKVKKVQ